MSIDSSDDVLREILTKFRPVTRFPHTKEIDEAIAAIHKAFADSGYLTPEQGKQVQELVNQMINNAQELAKLPVTVREVGTMTGKDWFDRFEKELNLIPNYKWADYKHDIIVLAAARINE